MRHKFFKPYVILCGIGALVLQIGLSISEGFTFDIRLLVLLVLLIMNSHYRVISVTNANAFSLNFPLLFPILVYFGAPWASVMASVGLISLDELELEWPVFLFNRASLGLAAGLSAVAFQRVGGLTNLAIALPMALFVYTLVNHGLLIIGNYFRGNAPLEVGSMLLGSLKTIPASAALAGLFYVSYSHFDILGLLGAYFVFITVRSGAFLGHLESNYRVSVIKALLRAVYAKDPDLMAHLENVAYYSKRLAKACHYPIWKLNMFDEASYFHDIGKLDISDAILKKEGRLSRDELEEMRSHPLRGIEFLKEVPLPTTHKKMVENITGSHHERYDGTGYPLQLKGEEIPLEARIVAVADTWDAMVGRRCYRQPMAVSDAIAELRRVKGTQLDPHLVEVFIKLVEEDLQNGKYAAEGVASFVTFL